MKTDEGALTRSVRTRLRASGAEGGGEGGGGLGDGICGGMGGIEGEIMLFARLSVARSWSRDHIPAEKKPVRMPTPPTPNRIVPVIDIWMCALARL